MRALLPFLPVHASLGGLSQLAPGCTSQVKLICLESQEFSNSFQQELNISIPLQTHCIQVMSKISELFRLCFLLVHQTDHLPLLAGGTGHWPVPLVPPQQHSREYSGCLWRLHSCVQFLMCRQHFQASWLKESSSLYYHCLVYWM